MTSWGPWAVAIAMFGLTAAPALTQIVTPPPAHNEILITGTRVPRDGDTPFATATSLSAETLLQTTPAGIPDALNKLPQFQLSSSPSRSTHNFANSASNGNILNLRGVGGSRTLILLDGLRVAPTTYRGEVDVDVLPGLLVERIDIVTMGASATYGSDAVAGAVNFVLDTKFNGVTAVAQTGIAQRGDNANHRLGLAVGTHLWGERAHLIFSAETRRSDGMLRSDRPDGRRELTFVGATGIGLPGSATNPLVIRGGVRLTTASEYGKVVGPATNPFVNDRFAADGSIAPFDAGIPTGTPGFSIGGDGFAIPANSSAIAATRATKGFARLFFDATQGLSLFAQVSASQLDEDYTSLANSFLDPTPALLFSGNPYLPADVQRTLTSSDAAFSLARYGASDPLPATHERTRFLMATLGAKGAFSDTIRWTAAYTHARSDHDVAQSAIWDWQNTYAAIDAVRDAGGAVVCRATLDPDPAVRTRFAACRPLNLLASGAAFTSQPGYVYAVGTSRYRAAVTQNAATVQFNAVPFRIAGNAVDIAFGAEYRRQRLDLTSNADPATLQSTADRAAYFAGLRGVAPSSLYYWLTNVGTAGGAVSVTEIFGELAVPLSATLKVNAAARATHYSTSGTEATWKAAAQWQATPDAQLRAGLSRDSRAPSLFELFAGPQSGIGLLVDPRSGQTGNVISISGGNPALRPERSTSMTLGTVVEPDWAPGFRLSIDYYRLRINGQIASLSITQIAQNCFANGGTAAECALIDQPDPTRLPTSIRTVPVNIAVLDTAGIDLDAAWRGPIGIGDLMVQLHANYLSRYRTRQGSGAPTLEFAGFGQTANQPIGRPRLRASLSLDYRIGDFGLSLAQQLLGRLKIGSEEPNQNYDGMTIDVVSYTDFAIRKRLPRGAELFLTVNNLFDRQPPVVPGTTPGLNYPTIISLYDTVGRAFTVGVRIAL